MHIARAHTIENLISFYDLQVRIIVMKNPNRFVVFTLSCLNISVRRKYYLTADFDHSQSRSRKQM